MVKSGGRVLQGRSLTRDVEYTLPLSFRDGQTMTHLGRSYGPK